MKLKASVAAVILAFSATGVWAGPSGTDNAASDLGSPDSTAVQPSAGPVNEELQWKFVNGSGGQDSSEQSAKSEDQDGDQAAKSAEEGGEDQAASSGQESDSDQAATSEEQEGNDQAATSESEDSDEQSAMTDEDDEDSDQAANEDEGGDQSANAEEQGDEEQSARSEDEDENDQSANSDQPAADLKDKVVVIIPKGWKGSISALITALESSPDAKDIVVVQQGEPQANNGGPDDNYSASQKPVINQQ